jgi:DNA-binding response OmpR family regulator
MTSTRLQERIDHLEHCLREITSPSGDVAAAEGLPKCQARILGALLKANGRRLSHGALMAAMYWDRRDSDWPETHIVQVQIHHLRQSLLKAGSPIVVQTIHGGGYRIDPKAPA